MARYTSTNPAQGDGVPALLGKLCQLFNGSPAQGDSIPVLLRKILSSANGSSADAPLRYVVNLTQVGTDAPVVTELENTLGALVWTRTAEGIYLATLAGAFPDVEKVFKIADQISAGQAVLSYISADQLALVTLQNGLPADGVAVQLSVLLEVYP